MPTFDGKTILKLAAVVLVASLVGVIVKHYMSAPTPPAA